MTSEETAWVAGILEGEGSFRARYSGPCISVRMTDRDVVERLHELISGSTLCGPYVRNGARSRKPIWNLNVTAKKAVVDLCEQIRPWMMERRRAQMDAMLAALDDPEWAEERRRRARAAYAARKSA